MCNRKKKEKISDDYLKTLDKVKEQYQQYVEISGLYTLPIQQQQESIQYQPPSLENPLTTNTTRWNAPIGTSIRCLPSAVRRCAISSIGTTQVN